MASAPVRMIFPFEAWKQTLREDCQRLGKLVAFDALGDSVLKLLWRTGMEPSVKAIVDTCPHARQDEQFLEKS